MQADEIAPLLFLFFACAVLSNLGFLWLAKQKRFHGFVVRAVQILAVMALAMPVYMALGLRARWEVYILFVVGAVATAPFSALCRSIMAELIPHTHTSTVMSFDGLLNTLTSWVGPLLVAIILDSTGSLRWGVLSSIVFAAIGLPLLLRFDPQKGIEERDKFEAALQGQVRLGDRVHIPTYVDVNSN
mmetsp:Transcript_11196/g.23347  ORF Transcript_11196/g.23347 Transcript_11196/m.23347 type:complete len:187 (-) Transcript_11196:102-662(-)